MVQNMMSKTPSTSQDIQMDTLDNPSTQVQHVQLYAVMFCERVAVPNLRFVAFLLLQFRMSLATVSVIRSRGCGLMRARAG